MPIAPTIRRATAGTRVQNPSGTTSLGGQFVEDTLPVQLGEVPLHEALENPEFERLLHEVVARHAGTIKAREKLYFGSVDDLVQELWLKVQTKAQNPDFTVDASSKAPLAGFMLAIRSEVAAQAIAAQTGLRKSDVVDARKANGRMSAEADRLGRDLTDAETLAIRIDVYGENVAGAPERAANALAFADSYDTPVLGEDGVRSSLEPVAATPTPDRDLADEAMLDEITAYFASGRADTPVSLENPRGSKGFIFRAVALDLDLNMATFPTFTPGSLTPRQASTIKRIVKDAGGAHAVMDAWYETGEATDAVNAVWDIWGGSEALTNRQKADVYRVMAYRPNDPMIANWLLNDACSAVQA